MYQTSINNKNAQKMFLKETNNVKKFCKKILKNASAK